MNYAKRLEVMLGELTQEYQYSDLDAMLVLKDILYSSWQKGDSKSNRLPDSSFVLHTRSESRRSAESCIGDDPFLSVRSADVPVRIRPKNQHGTRDSGRRAGGSSPDKQILLYDRQPFSAPWDCAKLPASQQWRKERFPHCKFFSYEHRYDPFV